MNNKIERASWWIEQGFALLPTQPGKKYLYAGYGEHQAKITRRDDVVKWFDNSSVNMSVCGHGGTIILDFDFPDLYTSWAEKHGDIANTYTEKTPRSGSHVFFFGSAPKGLKLIDGVELKRVCVVSPSVVNGRMYQAGEGKILEARAADIFTGLTVPGTKTAYLLETEKLKPRKPYRSNDLIEKIKSHYRLEDVWQLYRYPLSRDHRGMISGYYSVTCPFHDDHKPSMSLDIERQLYKCFACDAHGDVINLYAELQGITVREAIFRMSRKLNGGDR